MVKKIFPILLSCFSLACHIEPACKNNLFYLADTAKFIPQVGNFPIKDSVVANQCVKAFEVHLWEGDDIDGHFQTDYDPSGYFVEVKEGLSALINGDTIPYFWWNKPVGYSVKVRVKEIDTYFTEYNNILENKFYDADLRDSIYQIRFDSLGVGHRDDEDLVFFVGRKVGVVGMFHGEKSKNYNGVSIYAGKIYQKFNSYTEIGWNIGAESGRADEN